MKTFTIQPYEAYDVSFILNVCATRKEMLKQIKAYSAKHNGTGHEACPDTAGMFCPTYQKIDVDVPGIFTNSVFGTMFLCLEFLDIEIISHECLHGALTHQHTIKRYTGDFSDNTESDFDAQEDMAYFLGKAVDKVVKTIRQNYPKVKI